jgi:hypothetical protein
MELTLNLIGYRTEENRPRIQRATEPDVTVLRGTEAQRLRKTRCTHIIQDVYICNLYPRLRKKPKPQLI